MYKLTSSINSFSPKYTTALNINTRIKESHFSPQSRTHNEWHQRQLIHPLNQDTSFPVGGVLPNRAWMHDVSPITLIIYNKPIRLHRIAQLNCCYNNNIKYHSTKILQSEQAISNILYFLSAGTFNTYNRIFFLHCANI